LRAQIIGEFVNNAERDPRCIYPPGAQVACEHLVAGPVAVDARQLGVFYVARRSDTRRFCPTNSRSCGCLSVTRGGDRKGRTCSNKPGFRRAISITRSLHDPLTDLPNRVLLHDRLAQAISSGVTDQHVSLLVLGSWIASGVNDTLGHQCRRSTPAGGQLRLAARCEHLDTVARVWAAFTSLLPYCQALT